jgi:class 3 adenylate cyclase
MREDVWMSDVVTVDPLEAGREAYARRAWPEAYRLLLEADGRGGLDPEDLEALAKSAWWIGLATESIAAFERAYALHLERGNRSMAAMMALTLRREYGAKMAGSVAKAWLHRAEHLLEGEPEAVAHGYLEIAHRELDFDRGNLEGALAHLDRAKEIASRLDDADLPVWVAISRAEVLGTSGKLDEAFGLMEGAAAVAVGGELGPFTTGAVFCAVMSVCRETADYRRGSEWAEVSKRWCERQDISGFPGICRVHRAEFMRLTGAWADAASEAEKASDELQRFHPAMAGEAFHELGEIRLRMGDLVGAEDAFGQAHALGSESQPGRALLLLARGRTDAAAASIKGGLEELTWNKLARARLLPAQAEIAKMLGDRPTAEADAAELEAIAEEFGTAAIRAAAAHAAGLAALLREDAAEAIERFRDARRLWREIDAPYEAAISTVLLAEARSVAGETEAATLELEAARATFERLGATPDMARTDALLAGPAAPSGTREVRTFMFTDIVRSTQLVEAIGDEAWADLVRWHDQALRALFAAHGGEEVDHAGDGFFVAFAAARPALECSVAIQRALLEHRRQQGFAPQVRIGLHAAPAQRHGGAYRGKGVHVAARIAALAGAGEIVASQDTVDSVPPTLTPSAPRVVTLKGLSEPLAVVTLGWR